MIVIIVHVGDLKYNREARPSGQCLSEYQMQHIMIVSSATLRRQSDLNMGRAA